MAEPASRLYELRLPALADTRMREAVGTVLARWIPAPARPTDARALGRTGVVVRFSLGDVEATALLRDLYATGVAPASVVLRPLQVGGSEAVYQVFARHGGAFVPTWNWRAFVFG